MVEFTASGDRRPPQATILHRRSFADLPWAERMGDRLQALVAFDGYWDNPLHVDVETLEVGGHERESTRQRSVSELPAANLLLTPTDDGRQPAACNSCLPLRRHRPPHQVQRVSFPRQLLTTQLQDHPDLNTVHEIKWHPPGWPPDARPGGSGRGRRIASFVSQAIRTNPGLDLRTQERTTASASISTRYSSPTSLRLDQGIGRLDAPERSP